MLSRNTQLDRLQRIIDTQTAIVQQDFNLDRFMQVIVDTVQDLTAAKGAVVELIDGDYMVYRCASGIVTPHIGLRLRRDGSLSGLCVNSAEALRCDETDEDARVDKEACRRVGVRSMICTPLFQLGTPVGVLKVMSDQPYGFDDEDLQMLGLLAGMLGAALGKQLAFDTLQNAEMRMRVILENANDAVISVDGAGLIQRWNTAAERMFGFASEEVVGKQIALVGKGNSKRPGISDIFAQTPTRTPILDSLTPKRELEIASCVGREMTVEYSVSRNEFGAAVEVTAFVQDVTERKQMEESIREMALMDGLTGLANRRKMVDVLSHAIKRKKRTGHGMALLFMDLNDFKTINDHYGHDMGDRALQAFAERLVACVRESDVIGRLGGDEFVILAEGMNTENDARNLARKIIAALDAPLPGSPIKLASSIGISMYREQQDARQWLQEADKAMYIAKNHPAGGSRIAVYGIDSAISV